MLPDKHSPSLPPRWMVEFIQVFRHSLQTLHKRTFPAKVVFYEQFQFLYLLPSLYVAAKLNIAEHLSEGPQSVDSLAARSGADSEPLYRIMRALASHGIFTEKRDHRFALNRLSRVLIGRPDSLKYTLLQHLSPVNWQILGDLLNTVKTGKDGFTRKYGKNIYDYLKDHPEDYRLFDRSMSALSCMALMPIFQSYAFSGIETLVDIGGGEGFLLSHILHRNPSLHGILYDLPGAVSDAANTFQSAGLSERVTILTGDFFQSVPQGAEVYLMKNILHNWDDTRSVQLLSNIREAMPVSGKLIIIDMIVPGRNQSSFSKMIDIQMLASMPGGKERTRQEFRELLQKAGLTLNRVYKTIAPVSLLEASRIS